MTLLILIHIVAIVAIIAAPVYITLDIQRQKRRRTIIHRFTVRIPTEGTGEDMNPYSILNNMQFGEDDSDPLDPKNVTAFDVYLANQLMPEKEETEE